jgi:hypothetical protein
MRDPGVPRPFLLLPPQGLHLEQQPAAAQPAAAPAKAAPKASKK